MSNIDNLIRERLSKLRNESQIPSAEPSSSIPSPNKKSGVEEVEYLLQQLSAQTELEEKSMNERLDIDSQIRRRLARLKEESGGLLPPGPLRQTSSALRLEPLGDVTPPPLSFTGKTSDDSDVDDTCVMCDAAPTLACTGCFNDLYCQKCFKECHDPGENHQPKPLSKKKT